MGWVPVSLLKEGGEQDIEEFSWQTWMEQMAIPERERERERTGKVHGWKCENSLIFLGNRNQYGCEYRDVAVDEVG